MVVTGYLSREPKRMPWVCTRKGGFGLYSRTGAPGKTLRFCWVLDAEDTDGDGTDELLLGTGKNRGNEGRWSLPGGAHMRLHILESTSE